MVTTDFWAEIEARRAEHQARAKEKVAVMEAAGYTVTSKQTIHTCRVTVTSKATAKHCNPSGRVTDRPVYRESSSATTGYPFAIDAAFRKWEAHREAMQP